ncbi:MAG TPA: hypothetical protein VFG35_32085 [Actinoplanes sp.]|nr:hypothetical protein [Actinoplanes sp.]
MKLFRRDAGPGRSEWGLELLHGEVARLGAVIGAAESDLLAFEPNDLGRPYVVVDPDGIYHWKVVRDGEVLEDRTTTSREDILCWSFEFTTGRRPMIAD